MRRRVPILALAVTLAGLPVAEAAPVRPGLQPHPPIARPPLRRRRFFFRPFLRMPRGRVRPPPELLPSPPPGEFLQPLPSEPGSPLGGQVGPRPPLAHGFQLTVPVGSGATFKVPATLGRYVDVGQALGACFAPPSDVTWGAITLRVSFRRDGSVFGDPRIPYSDADTPEQKSELARSLLAGLKRCTPLPLSPSLGGAVAGEIFAIRFTHQDQP